MSKIGHLQNRLEEIFDEFMLKFINKLYWIQLQYKVERKNRIFVLTRIFRKNADMAIMKSTMYVVEVRNLDFLRAYLAGLAMTLGVW